MRIAESETDRLRRLIADGRAVVVKQREIVARIRARGGEDPQLAESLLATFESGLELYRARLARVEAHAIADG